MARLKSGSIPSYRHYKRTNQAVVTINGKDHYLGEYGSPASRQSYDRLIAEFLARSRAGEPSVSSSDGSAFTINMLVLAYYRHARSYYSDSPCELEKIRFALRPVRKLYGR